MARSSPDTDGNSATRSKPLCPRPSIDWTPKLRSKLDRAWLALGHLEQLGIVRKLTARKRNHLFSYAGYTKS
ncbi:hypothetical protein [Desulfobulbus elongatus]|uniref:hypothetical protein n=1 Tax=Desulfobulbus elongatus TaxID=53332 RepID=UPI001FDEDDEB|nr:hypothetical protein [Desulfobulbus elongatus]